MKHGDSGVDLNWAVRAGDIIILSVSYRGDDRRYAEGEEMWSLFREQEKKEAPVETEQAISKTWNNLKEFQGNYGHSWQML